MCSGEKCCPGFPDSNNFMFPVAGLKGVSSLSIALTVLLAARGGHEHGKTGQMLMFHIGAVYFSTATINASLAVLLTQFLKLNSKPRADV